MEQSAISASNAAFWDELCGSVLAKSLGIVDASPASLKKFDDWYFDFYPYLFHHIPFPQLARREVLEVGLGYGTVSQRLAESGASYTGLDIAPGPVAMAQHRLQQSGLPGCAVQGSILQPDFADESFDCIVAIGCLHHTGNLKLAIDQCWRLLRPKGKLIFMVYYAYSYRRLQTVRTGTFTYMLRELTGYRGVFGESSEHERAAYDAGSGGAGAPHTDWISVRSLRHYCKAFTAFAAKIENIDQEGPFIKTPRADLLRTRWPSIVGLDLYATATK